MTKFERILSIIFYLLCLLYISSYCLPVYTIPPFLKEMLNVNDPLLLTKVGPIVYGYEAAFIAIQNMSVSPVAFIGSLANLTVLAIILLQMLRVSGKLTRLRSLFVIICIVSVLIWAVVLRRGFSSGYFLWSFTCIGLSLIFAITKPYQPSFDDTLLDEVEVENR